MEKEELVQAMAPAQAGIAAVLDDVEVGKVRRTRRPAAIEIKELAGHQSIANTNRYMRLASERQRTATAVEIVG